MTAARASSPSSAMQPPQNTPSVYHICTVVVGTAAIVGGAWIVCAAQNEAPTTSIYKGVAVARQPIDWLHLWSPCLPSGDNAQRVTALFSVRCAMHSHLTRRSVLLVVPHGDLHRVVARITVHVVLLNWTGAVTAHGIRQLLRFPVLAAWN